MEQGLQREQVVSTLRAVLPELLEPHPVLLAYLHGSVAEGYARPDSDVDIALVFQSDAPLSPAQRVFLELDLGSEIEEHCGWREVDVRSIDRAPLTVQGQIITHGILVYSRDEEQRIEFEVSVRRLYLDYLPTYRRLQAAFLDHLWREGLHNGKQ